MNQFLKRAKELESQLQADRRYLHQHAEAGEDLPNTTKYVMERLREIGLNTTVPSAFFKVRLLICAVTPENARP